MYNIHCFYQNTEHNTYGYMQITITIEKFKLFELQNHTLTYHYYYYDYCYYKTYKNSLRSNNHISHDFFKKIVKLPEILQNIIISFKPLIMIYALCSLNTSLVIFLDSTFTKHGNWVNIY